MEDNLDRFKIDLLGVPGVGKTTFCNYAAQRKGVLTDKQALVVNSHHLLRNGFKNKILYYLLRINSKSNYLNYIFKTKIHKKTLLNQGQLSDLDQIFSMIGSSSISAEMKFLRTTWIYNSYLENIYLQTFNKSGEVVLFDESVLQKISFLFQKNKCGLRVESCISDYLKSLGAVVYFKAPIDLILKRLKERNKQRLNYFLKGKSEQEIAYLLEDMESSQANVVEQIKEMGIPVFEINSASSLAVQLEKFNGDLNEHFIFKQ